MQLSTSRSGVKRMDSTIPLSRSGRVARVILLARANTYGRVSPLGCTVRLFEAVP